MKVLEKYRAVSDLPIKIPVFPLAGALLLPRAQLPLNIFEPRYLQMVDDAMSADRLIGMAQPVGEDGATASEDPGAKPSFYPVGCAGRITSYTDTPDGRVLITLTGVCRFKVRRELDAVTPYRICEADFAAYRSDLVVGQGENSVDREALLKTFRKYLEANRMDADWDEVENATTEALVNTLCVISPYAGPEKQAMLEAETLSERTDILIALTEMALASGDHKDSGPSSVQ